MTGGVAYVYDERRTLAARCNTEMVRLCTPSEAELEQIRALIEEHVRYTASPRGIKLLYQFATASRRFVKVVPIEYERALKIVEEAERRGATREQALEEAFEAITA